jgi:large subunit ribosomal protein L4
MPEMDIKDASGKSIGKIALPDEVFAAPVKRHLLHEAVRNYRAGGRAGTHDTKNRMEVSGGGKKPWKQKHTGRSRHGSSRSPLWRKGGTVQGPTPRDYSYALPKQMRRGALRSALTLKFKNEHIVVMETIALDSAKTRDLGALIEGGLGLSKKVLIVHNGENANLGLAARNHPRFKAVRAMAVNVYDILNHDYLVMSRGAVEKVGEVLSQ